MKAILMSLLLGLPYIGIAQSGISTIEDPDSIGTIEALEGNWVTMSCGSSLEDLCPFEQEENALLCPCEDSGLYITGNPGNTPKDYLETLSAVQKFSLQSLAQEERKVLRLKRLLKDETVHFVLHYLDHKQETGTVAFVKRA